MPRPKKRILNSAIEIASATGPTLRGGKLLRPKAVAKYLVWLGAFAAVLILVPSRSFWDIDAACNAPAVHTLLGQIWCWLKINKDSIAPISQLLAAIGVAVAALTFWRTQKLNQATAVFQTMKEARDLQLKLKPLPSNRNAPPDVQIQVGLHFFASIYQYQLLDFIDQETWKPFEDDLVRLLRNPDVAKWLFGGQPAIILTPVRNFDARFIQYLKAIHKTRVCKRLNLR